MQIRTKVLIGFTAAALASGCASSGGSGTVTNADGTASDMTGEDFLLCLLTAGLACGGTSSNAEGASASTASSNTTSATSSGVSTLDGVKAFTKWSDLVPGQEMQAAILWTGFSWSQSPIESIVSYPVHGYQQAFRYGTDGVPIPIALFQEKDARASLASLGHAGIDVWREGFLPSDFQSPFVSLRASDVHVTANPLTFDWDYQSFGAWTSISNPSGTAAAVTFGAPTPGASVPTVGSATFTGKLAGFYLSSTGTGQIAAADLNVHANFATRTLNLGSSGTTLTRDFITGTPAPNLNVSGTLSYAAGSGDFRGNLTNAGGTMSGSSQGRFYGPAAQELGGVFTLKSPTTVESFAGAYGAKR